MPEFYCSACDAWWPTFNPDTDPDTDLRCPDCDAPLSGPPDESADDSDSDPDSDAPYFHARPDSCMYPW